MKYELRKIKVAYGEMFQVLLRGKLIGTFDDKREAEDYIAQAVENDQWLAANRSE